MKSKQNSWKNIYLIAIFTMLGLASCFKEDTVIVLPPQTGSQLAVAGIGKNYDTTIFLSLETGKVVKSIKNDIWDLRFATGDNEFNILLNSDKVVRAFETKTTNINTISDTSGSPEIWGYDSPVSYRDSGYLRNWHSGGGISKGKVYVVSVGGDGYYALAFYKIKLINATADQYIFQFDTITATNPKTIVIPKDKKKNYVYVSLEYDGQIVDGEPAKTDWDLCITRYAEIFYTNPLLVYPINGALINPYNTFGAGDTTRAYNFSKFNADSAKIFTLTNNDNTIGYTWKTFTNKYITHPEYMYVVRTQKNHLYKLHFLDFYLNGTVGYPKMEFERIE